jgi:hypothetical protein
MRHHFVCEPVHPDTEKVHYEFNRSLEEGKEPEHYTFDVSQRIVDGMMDTFKSVEDVCEFVLEDVIET